MPCFLHTHTGKHTFQKHPNKILPFRLRWCGPDVPGSGRLANISWLTCNLFPLTKQQLTQKTLNESKMNRRKACGVNFEVHTQKFKRKFSQILSKDLRSMGLDFSLKAKTCEIEPNTKYILCIVYYCIIYITLCNILYTSGSSIQESALRHTSRQRPGTLLQDFGDHAGIATAAQIDEVFRFAWAKNNKSLHNSPSPSGEVSKVPSSCAKTNNWMIPLKFLRPPRLWPWHHYDVDALIWPDCCTLPQDKCLNSDAVHLE